MTKTTAPKYLTATNAATGEVRTICAQEISEIGFRRISSRAQVCIRANFAEGDFVLIQGNNSDAFKSVRRARLAPKQVNAGGIEWIKLDSEVDQFTGKSGFEMFVLWKKALGAN